MIFFVFMCTCACLIVCACTICAQVSEEARRWCRISWSWSYIHTVLSHPIWISAAEPGSSTREQAVLSTKTSFQFPTFLLYIPTSCQFVVPGVPSNFVSWTFNFVSYFLFLKMPRVCYHTLWASLFYYCWPVCARCMWYIYEGMFMHV